MWHRNFLKSSIDVRKGNDFTFSYNSGHTNISLTSNGDLLAIIMNSSLTVSDLNII